MSFFGHAGEAQPHEDVILKAELSHSNQFVIDVSLLMSTIFPISFFYNPQKQKNSLPRNEKYKENIDFQPIVKVIF